MTTVEIFRSGSYESIKFASFEIELGISTRKVAPEAKIEISSNESVTPGQAVRIQIDGSTKFQGEARSGGTKRDNNPMEVKLRHPTSELFNSAVDISLTSRTDEEVLNAAITNADTEAAIPSVTYAGSATSLANDYEVEDRDVRSVFQDMMDRTDRVWRVEPTSNTIHVEPKRDRGTWVQLDTANDRIAIPRFDSGSIDTVVNDVTVNGTGGERVTGTATDATSQSTYGKQSVVYNVQYAITQSEADAIASALLQPDPVAEGEIMAGRSTGNIEDSQVNKEVDLTDGSKDIDVVDLLIEYQKIEQGMATFEVGGGVGRSTATSNRERKSRGDITLPGSVFGTDRIADDSIEREKLKDRAVDNAKIELSTIIAENIQDSEISQGKIADAAVNNDKLENLSISETKIQDDAVDTPKLNAEAVTASEIKTNTITSSQIAAGTIGATRLFITDWIPIGLSFTDNDPGGGDISWNSHSLVYEGTEHDISSGSTSDKYVYWLEGNSFYSTAPDGSKPDLGNDDAMVAINDGGTARQILQATEIHGGAIRTGTIEAAEIKSGVITTDLLDALNIETGDLQIVDNDGDGVEFNLSGSTVVLEPTTAGAGGIGSSGNRYGLSYFTTVNLDTLNVGEIGPQGSTVGEGFETGDVNLSNVYLRPTTDDRNFLGDSTKAFQDIWAYDFVDASTGSAINDGGDPLEGLADGTGPPEHATRTDDAGDDAGYSLIDMARSAWQVNREQQRVIERLEGTVQELTERIERLEQS